MTMIKKTDISKGNNSNKRDKHWMPPYNNFVREKSCVSTREIFIQSN